MERDRFLARRQAPAGDEVRVDQRGLSGRGRPRERQAEAVPGRRRQGGVRRLRVRAGRASGVLRLRRAGGGQAERVPHPALPRPRQRQVAAGTERRHSVGRRSLRPSPTTADTSPTSPTRTASPSCTCCRCPKHREVEAADAAGRRWSAASSFSPDGKRLAVTLNTATSPSDVPTSSTWPTRKLTRWTQSEVGGLDPSKFVAPTLVRYPDLRPGRRQAAHDPGVLLQTGERAGRRQASRS